MFSTSLLAQWCQTTFGLLIPDTGLTFLVGPDMPEMPDEVALITRLPGAGLKFEGAFDQPAFQFAVRGLQQDPNDVTDPLQTGPEQWADTIDGMVLSAAPNSAWGTYVTAVDRAGGGPSPVQRLDAGRRATYTCTYVVTLATG